MSSCLLPGIIPPDPPKPLPHLDVQGSICLYHPKYPHGVPILLFSVYLFRDDGVGVPLGLVLDACFVVAGNRRGQLRYLNSEQRVASDEDDPDMLLGPGEYIFVVVQEGGELDYNYPLCASFIHWTPPETIPARWMGGQATQAQQVKLADKVCIVTGAHSGLRASHLVPESEAKLANLILSEFQFERNSMILEGYGGDPACDLTSVHNEVTLREDLRLELNTGLFLLRSLRKQRTGGDLAYMYHFRQRKHWGGGEIGLAEKKPKTGVTGSSGDNSARNRNSYVADSSYRASEGNCPTAAGKRRTPRRILTEDEEEYVLAMFEAQDAALEAQPYLTVDDVAAGRYPGFSKIKRLMVEYRRAHPEVSAVGDVHFWEGDHDDDDARGIE
ncbi:hypothetical protein B0H11DRAFT_2024623 [Mycena galericulata]|nr:hypothetical protein B0H11DRAFT_2024623 [Mycena galericulata]